MPGGPSITDFLSDREIEHAMDATHIFVDSQGKKRYACLEDRDSDLDELSRVVANNREENVQIQEILTPTYGLHFEMKIYNGDRSNLQSLVKAMTQAMLNGPSTMQPGIWNLTVMKTWIYAMSFKDNGEDCLYAQVTYPEVTVTKKQHAVCYKMLQNKLADSKDIVDITKRNSEMNVFQKMVRPIDERNSVPIAMPLTMQHVENSTSPVDSLKPMFCVSISASSVKKGAPQRSNAELGDRRAEAQGPQC